jgi:hypothetical protein
MSGSISEAGGARQGAVPLQDRLTRPGAHLPAAEDTLAPVDTRQKRVFPKIWSVFTVPRSAATPWYGNSMNGRTLTGRPLVS